MGYIDFPAEEIALKQVYRSKETRQFRHIPLEGDKLSRVYGELAFPEPNPERTYTYGSFVTSVDGRIAFPESPDGTLIARKNLRDPAGGLCDYWILTLLRAVSDAVLMGSLTIKREPELTARIADQDLESLRTEGGKGAVPLHVVVTRSGKNIPLDHTIFTSSDIPALIATSPAGKEEIEKRLELDYFDLGSFSSTGMSESSASLENLRFYSPATPLALAALGTGDQFDDKLLPFVLKRMQVHSMLVESPTFLVSLMHRRLLDELWLNTSGLFVGGNALTIGENAEAFTAESHPHTRVLSMHSHSDHFFYTRYGLLYGEAAGEVR